MRYEFTVGRSCRVKTFLRSMIFQKDFWPFEGGHIWVWRGAVCELILSMKR